MRLNVNGQDIDVTLEDEKTVGDVLKSFETAASQNEATTVGIVLDGEAVSPDRFDEILGRPLEDTTALELTVLTKGQLIDSLRDVSDRIGQLSLEDIPVLLQGGKDKEAAAIIDNLATDCQAFFHTASMASLFPELYGKLAIDGADFMDFFKDFLTILSDFKDAMEGNDTVTVGDLAEYELEPRLKAVMKAIASL
ncbi:MAG: hypothetical protein J6Y13_05025 [Treponema sp.]|nr:hypothetical protein [Treponema sp.]